MTRDEMDLWDERMVFMAGNHRRPSKYYVEESNNWNRMRQQEVMGKGEMKEERVELFERLMDLCGEYRRVNQWM